MTKIRSAEVAGNFYPGDKRALSASVKALLEAATINPHSGFQKAIIAPHAGHLYSGPIAASVYKAVLHHADLISRVILLGPSHHMSFRGIAVSSADFYETPLGSIELDQEANKSIMSLAATFYSDEAHQYEHSLEVHLPFLQVLLEEFSLVPLVVGDATKEEVAAVLDKLWGGPETLVIISSDLSHFHDYKKAQLLDKETSRKIINLQSNLSGKEACGCRPINGLLHLLKKKGLKIQEIDLRNSGDTAGSHDSVVGYGAYSLLENGELGNKRLDEKYHIPIKFRQQIVQTAANAILHTFEGDNNNYDLDIKAYPDILKAAGAAFITLKINGNLRGCIGSLEAHRPLILDVAHNARSAAFEDSRFSPLTFDEFRNSELHISILSPPEPMGILSYDDLLSSIRPNIDGIILEQAGRRATYLPSVWEQLPQPKRFIQSLRSKAGLDPLNWQNCYVQRYTTEEFSQ